MSYKNKLSYILSTTLLSYQIKTSNANSILLLRGIAKLHKQIKCSPEFHLHYYDETDTFVSFSKSLHLIVLLYFFYKSYSIRVQFILLVHVLSLNWFQVFRLFTMHSSPIALLKLIYNLQTLGVVSCFHRQSILL